MPSILIFCKTLLKGGAEKQALFLSKLLLGKNVDICLVNWCGDQIDAENLKFIQLNSIKYFPLKGIFFVKFYHYLKILRKEKISISVSYLTLPNFVSGMSKFFFRRILTVGGIRNENISNYKLLFEKWIHNRLNDATVFNNYSARDKFVKRGFKSEKINVIHNAIEVPAFLNKPVTSGNELFVISVSRFVKQKDFHTAIYAFNRLLEMGISKNVIYYVVGYGPLEQDIRLLVKTLGIEHQIRILINPKNIPDILRSCDVYLSTSLFEGLPNSIMEAMAVGLPVVATDVGDNKYLVREGLNGYLLPCRDIEQIAGKLQHLLESEDERKEFGENSYNFIKENFTQEKLLNSYLELFSKINSNKIF